MSLESARVHESGHVLAAEVFGRLPFEVIVRDACHGGARFYGPAALPWPDSIDPDHWRRETFEQMVISLAGAQACRAFGFPNWSRGAGRDRGQAWWTAIREVGHERADAFLAEATDRAAELVQQHRDAIEWLAGELERNGDRLVGRELSVALAEALGKETTR